VTAVREVLTRAGLIAFGALFAVPYALILTASFRPSESVARAPLDIFGGGWSLGNYRAVLADNDVLGFYVNSVIVTTAIVAAEVVLGAAAAIALGHLRPAGGRVVGALVVATISVPIQAIAVTNYLTIDRLDLVNTRLGLIVPFAASAFGIYLMTEYAAAVPASQLDSARVFGLGPLSRIRHIVLPHMRPGIVAFAAFAFVGWWNEFFWPFIVLQGPELATVPFSIQTYIVNPGGLPDWGPMMAAGALALLPLMILLVLVQRSFVRMFAFSS